MRPVVRPSILQPAYINILVYVIIIPYLCSMKTKLNTFITRMDKIGINIELFGNYPWIYIDKINGKKVTEKFQGNHGFTIAFTPIKPGKDIEFTDIKEIFNLIRKYK